MSKNPLSRYAVPDGVQTIRLMKEIDEVIERHGGWPGTLAPAAQQ